MERKNDPPPMSIEQLWEQVYAIQGHPEITGSDLTALRSIIHKLNDYDAPEPKRDLLRGYILYHFGHSLAAHRTCAEYFENVLKHEPDNDTALLYLGHYYFDNGDYHESRIWLRRVHAEHYISAHQRWRTLKIRELIAACDIMLGDLDQIADDLTSLVADLQSASNDEFAVPSELIRSIAANADVLVSEVSREMLVSLAERLRSMAVAQGVDDLLREDLAIIESSVARSA